MSINKNLFLLFVFHCLIQIWSTIHFQTQRLDDEKMKGLANGLQRNIVS